MTSRWSWLALGVGAYLAFTLAAFPASTALRWLAPPGVTFAGVEGTLWSGNAASGTVAGFATEGLRWRVQPWSLLFGRVAGNIEARIPDGFVSTNVAATPSRVRFSDLRAGTSVPALAGVLPVPGIRGQMSAALESLELENAWPSNVVGELKLVGLEAAPFIPNGTGELLTLGDYTATFIAAPERELAARFVDDGGPLEVSGTVKVDAGRAYTLDALIEARAGAPEALVEGLEIMTAEPDAEGRRRLTMTGSL